MVRNSLRFSGTGSVQNSQRLFEFASILSITSKVRIFLLIHFHSCHFFLQQLSVKLIFQHVILIGISVSTQEIPTMITPRSFSAVVGSDYNVFVIGGISRYKLTASCECYSVQDNKWFPLPCFPVAIHGSAAALPNHTLCVVGGKTNELGIEKRAWV